MQEHNELDLISTTDAAAVVKTTRQTIGNWVRTGKITGYRVGPRKLLVDRQEVLAQISKVQPKTPQPYGPGNDHVSARFVTELLPITHAEVVRLVLSREVDGYKGVSDHYVNLFSLREWWSANR